ASDATRTSALEGVLFYLAAYGIMNVGAFGVLMMLPTRQKIVGPNGADVPPPATTAETFDDLRGTGRANPVLGLAMAVSCFSLIGLPLTVGFLGKFFIIRPAFESGLYSLVVITMINAAISAAYYLRIVGTMFLQDPETDTATLRMPARPLPLTIATAISVVGSLLFGAVPQAIEVLNNQTITAAVIETDSMIPPSPILDDEDLQPAPSTVSRAP
ncbi:MAG TPA: proton-conducting transporter membrane subunit, partial [Tepidisphaeraceae bacterium]|nr:proton-conducting transporter membrane subunit [Tepidisphaeraceae bacterium]